MLVYSLVICFLLGALVQSAPCADNSADGGGTIKQGDGNIKQLSEDVVQYKESVNLDQITAHPNLVLSANWKSATFENTSQNLDNNTARFDSDPCVLGSQGYNSGKHYWVVAGTGGWLVGVASANVQRKGFLTLSTEAGIYAFPRPQGDCPEKVGVYLNCDDGQVSFINADTMKMTFKLDVDCGETVYPFFFIQVGNLKLE